MSVEVEIGSSRAGSPGRMVATAFSVWVSLFSVAADAEQTDTSVMRLPFSMEDKGWAFAGTDPYEGWVDRRELYVIYHPWTPSQTGHMGTLSREIHIPSDWEGRARLHFYMTDDYHGDHPELTDGTWVGQMKLIGHRFKQVLANGKVIWERDVGDPEGVSQQSRFSVLLPEWVEPGQTIRLSFRMVDTTTSKKRLPEDHRHIGTTDHVKEADPWKFRTHLYIGDVVLTPERIESVEPGELPTSARVRAVHQRRWPLDNYGGKTRFPVPLTWEGWADVKGITCVVRCGVPLPAGQVRDVDQVVLRDRGGKRLPVQVSPMNTWPDKSLRWVEVDTIATADDQTKELFLDRVDTGSATESPKDPVVIQSRRGHEVTIVTGDTEITLGDGNDILMRRFAAGDSVLEDLRGEVEIGGQTYRTVVDKTEVLASGPVRAEIELSGTLRADDHQIGPFVFRLAAFAGQPYVRMTWRIVNMQPRTLKVARFELVGRTSMRADAVTRWGGAEKTGRGDVRVQQLVDDRFDVLDSSGHQIDSGKAAEGWLGATDRHGTFMVMVRHFREQFSKALELKDGRLRISLFEASTERPHYLPTEGEAKRHEIWMGLWNRELAAKDMARLARYFARPSRLFSSDYFCASGGFGYAAPHNAKRFSEFDAYVDGVHGKISAEQFYVNDIRHWGDQVYKSNDKVTQWANGYYDRQQGIASAYLMSGDPCWFDRLEATVRHIMDIDVCHASAAHPEWVGSIHSYEGPNHTSGAPWNTTQRPKGMLSYWRYTGDIDARRTALGVANSALRENRGIGDRSSRTHAGILYSLMAAYDETHDPKFLQAAGPVVRDAISRIDPRRGCYAEVHGNISYRGNVPWMDAQLAEPIYDYYRHSGDVDAAIAVVALAESILAENRTRDVPGDIFGYSHNPHFPKTSSYHLVIGPAIAYAYELTGNDDYLAHCRAMYTQTIREKTVMGVMNCYWNIPTLFYYLQESDNRKEKNG